MGKTIGIIIPVLNEYECIDELVSRLNKVIKTLENKAYKVSITFIDGIFDDRVLIILCSDDDVVVR